MSSYFDAMVNFHLEDTSIHPEEKSQVVQNNRKVFTYNARDSEPPPIKIMRPKDKLATKNSKREIPNFVKRKNDYSQAMHQANSQSQPELLPPRVVPPPKRPNSPKHHLRTTAGNMLYKSIPDGNPYVEYQNDLPKYYNNNFPVQAEVVHANNQKTKSTYLRKLISYLMTF
jgi:hypothetical protein